MPHKQKHRGPRQEDHRWFGSAFIPVLQEAVFDYAFLLSRQYSEDAIMKTVGDRYQLHKRQRLAVMRSACSLHSLKARENRRLSLQQAKDQPLYIDGFNLLITIECALSGGMIFEGMDGVYRDLSSIHASYKRVEETFPALKLIGKYLQDSHSGGVHWLLDSPVSNSGRLKQYILETAQANGWTWDVELAKDPDHELTKIQNGIVVSLDGVILDGQVRWLNLAKAIIDAKNSNFWHIDLKINPEAGTSGFRFLKNEMKV